MRSMNIHSILKAHTHELIRLVLIAKQNCRYRERDCRLLLLSQTLFIAFYACYTH